MKIRPGYLLRQVMDLYVVLATDSETYDPSHSLSVNEAGALLWRMLEEGAEKDGLADRLVQEYEIDRDLAMRDTEKFLAQLRDRGILIP